MSGSLTGLARSLISGWLSDGAIPDQALEGVGPRLAAALGCKPAELELSEFLEPAGRWGQSGIEFADAFDGAFAFVVPEHWDELRQQGPIAQLGQAGEVRLSVVLMPVEHWRDSLGEYFEVHDIEALWYAARFRDIYLHWMWVTGGDEGEPWWVWSVSSSGDWLVLTKGDAADSEALREQLSVALCSNPWAGWIAAAQRGG